MPRLIIGLVIGLGLLVGAWLLFRNRPVERQPAFQSALLLFFLLFPLRFMFLILHEGGHALWDVARGEKGLTLYVHPFAFDGYSRPIFGSSVGHDASATVVAILVSLLVFIPLWKRRSLANLPFVMLFPWVALDNGIYMLAVEGDFRNITQATGLSPIVFIALGSLIVGLGIFWFISLFPLLGLAPQDKKILFVIPASMFLWGVLSMLVAYLFVPGSPFAVRYGVANEVLSANWFIWMPIIGELCAVIYVTLYRRVYRRLPAGLQTETVTLTWKDLRLPGLLFAISVILGLIIIL
jgi:hypothetical protein